MLCEKCKKNEATFYYHENVNGNQKNYRLCADCAKELEKSGELKAWDKVQEDPFEGFGKLFTNPFKQMDKLFSGLFGAPALTGGISQTKGQKQCSCGMTLRDFLDEGMAGCPDCYSTFEEELEPTVRRIHGKSAHEGRIPTKFRGKMDTRKKIEQLEKERSEAVRLENYERAAEIRDQLNELRKNLEEGA